MDLFSCLSSFYFCSLNSGSNGNSYFVGTDEYGVLIDAGISATQIVNRLKSIDYDIGKIKALFLTHDHIDHIKGVKTLVNRYNIPVYARESCLQGLITERTTKGVNRDLLNDIESQMNINDIHVESFDTPHDGAGSVGYFIAYQDNNITIATDIGHITDVIDKYLQKADTIVIESNYDKEMLLNGAYPYPLKKRIIGENGHLSNDEAAEFISKHYRADMKNIFLCHLSGNNNSPEVAMRCLYRHLKDNKVKISEFTTIMPLSREKCSTLINL